MGKPSEAARAFTVLNFFKPFSWYALIAFQLLTFDAASNGQSSGIDLLNRIESEHAKFADRFGNAKGFVERSTSKMKGYDPDPEVGEYFFNSQSVRKLDFENDNSLWESSNQNGNAYGGVVGVANSRYYFELNPNQDSWSLNKYHIIQGEPKVDTKSYGFRSSCLRPSQVNFKKMPTIVALGGQSTRELTTHDLSQLTDFKLISAAQSDDKAILEFEYTEPNFDRIPNAASVRPRIESRIVFDAANHYLPIELTQKCDTPRWKHELQTNVQWVVKNELISKSNTIVNHKVFQDDELFNEETFTSEALCEYRRVPEREFKLTAYGLPEPSELKSESWSVPLYLWLMLFGFICIGLSFWVYQKRQNA